MKFEFLDITPATFIPRSLQTNVVERGVPRLRTKRDRRGRHLKMSFYYFYILQSKKNGKLYLGSSSNWERRLKQHNSGTELSTKSNILYEIIYFAGFINKKDATDNEQYFKTTAGWRRLKRMLKNTL